MSSSEEVFACSGSVSFSSSEREEVVARSHGYESSISSDPDPNDLGASDQPHDPRRWVGCDTRPVLCWPFRFHFALLLSLVIVCHPRASCLVVWV